MVTAAPRCQRCGEFLTDTETGKWCDGCPPPARSNRSAKPDPYNRMARDLVKQGLASDRVTDSTYAPRSQRQRQVSD